MLLNRVNSRGVLFKHLKQQRQRQRQHALQIRQFASTFNGGVSALLSPPSVFEDQLQSHASHGQSQSLPTSKSICGLPPWTGPSRYQPPAGIPGTPGIPGHVLVPALVPVAAEPVPVTRRRSNHTVKLAGHSSNTRTPPPPPDPTNASITSATSLQSFSRSAQLSGTTRSLSSSTDKIAAQRSAQIARHFSSSASRPFDQTLHKPEPTMASSFGVRKVAAPNTLEHRVYVEKDGVPVSPFHDVPLYANQEQTILNMVVEIPRWTNAKLEVRLPFYRPLLESRHFISSMLCLRDPSADG